MGTVCVCKWCSVELPDGNTECLDCLVAKGELSKDEWADFMAYQWDVQDLVEEELDDEEPIPYMLTLKGRFSLSGGVGASVVLEALPALIIGGCHA